MSEEIKQKHEYDLAQVSYHLPKDLRREVKSYLGQNTCQDVLRENRCKGINSRFVNEETKQELDCRYICLANCKPEELEPL